MQDLILFCAWPDKANSADKILISSQAMQPMFIGDGDGDGDGAPTSSVSLWYGRVGQPFALCGCG
jgi:hypothetical protein